MMIATGHDDDIPAIIESAYAHASLASGNGEFEQEAYKAFCKDLTELEAVLKARGILDE